MDNQVFVMLNPINQKLRKLFSKGKRNLKTQSSLHVSIYSKSFRGLDKENDSHISNNTNDTCRSFFMKKQAKIKQKQQNVQKILQDNQRLKEKIKTHQLMEQFYLKELEIRRQQKTNLEWRLSILNEQIQNSSQIKKKCIKGGQILNERVNVARKGLDYSEQDFNY